MMMPTEHLALVVNDIQGRRRAEAEAHRLARQAPRPLRRGRHGSGRFQGAGPDAC